MPCTGYLSTPLIMSFELYSFRLCSRFELARGLSATFSSSVVQYYF